MYPLNAKNKINVPIKAINPKSTYIKVNSNEVGCSISYLLESSIMMINHTMNISVISKHNNTGPIVNPFFYKYLLMYKILIS